MATLRDLHTDKELWLAARTVVGRGPSCELRIDDPRVSGLHAELAWTGEHWQLRDLGSRNGTFVAGTRVELGARVRLNPGVEIIVADAARFRLIDASSPKLHAVCVHGFDGDAGQRVGGDMLVLPNDEAPLLSIYRDRDGAWVAEDAERCRRIEDGEQLLVGGQSWRLYLPETVIETRSSAAELRLDSARLHFTVSRDEEHVELRIVPAEHLDAIEVEPRAHLALLLTLARARLEDAANPELDVAEHGWVHREDLAKMLAIGPELLNLWIHRARKQLMAQGLLDAAWIIERRAATTQLRIGASQLFIKRT